MARSEDDFEEAKNDLFEDESVNKYEGYIKHLAMNVMPRAMEWAMFHRVEENLPTRGMRTTNICESSFKVGKEKGFNRLRAFNFTHAAEILMNHDKYYKKRTINSTMNKNMWKFRKSKYNYKETKIDPTKIVVKSPTTFKVPSETDKDVFYNVDTKASTCECFKGANKAPCKHKMLVYRYFKINAFDINPRYSQQMRAFFYYLATGRKGDQIFEYFQPLQQARELSCDIHIQIERNPQTFSNTKDVPSDVKVEHKKHSKNSNETASDYDSGEDIDVNNYKHIKNKEEFIKKHKEEVLISLEEHLKMIYNKVKDSFHEDPENIKKAVEAFSAQAEKLSKGNTQNMARALFTFGKEMKTGRRRNAGRIPSGVSFTLIYTSPLVNCFT